MDKTRQQTNPADSAQERKLRDEILADARKKAERALKRAERDVEKAAEKQRKELEKLEARRMAEAERLANGKVNAVLSRIDHEKNKLAIGAAEEIVQQVFAEFANRIAGLESGRRTEILQKWLREALAAVADDSPVVLVGTGCESELRSLPEANKRIIKNLPARRKDDFGVVVESDDGRRRFDNTLSSRMQRFNDELRLAVADALDLDQVHEAIHTQQ